MTAFRVGIDSYCLNPLRLDPNTILTWVSERGGEGVQFSEVFPPPNQSVDPGFLQELAATARNLDMYIEWGGGQHVPFDTTNWNKKDLLPGNRRAAEAANLLDTRVVRSCSGGFFRWNNEAPPTEELLYAMANALKPQQALFEDLGVTLAIELHFEFTTFELCRLFDMCDAEPGGWLGICLDTFNMLPMLEDPVAGTARILPWIVATHIKDGCIKSDSDGLRTYPTQLGLGSVDVPAILDLLATKETPPNLSLEDHGGDFLTAIYDDDFLSRFPDLTVAERSALLKKTSGNMENFPKPTDRGAWPQICETRTEAGLRYLRKIAASRIHANEVNP